MKYEELSDNERIALERFRRQMPQEEMAVCLDVSQPYLSMIEWGRRTVSKRVRARFNSYFMRRSKSLTDGERWFIRFRRRGFTMKYGASFFGVTVEQLMSWFMGHEEPSRAFIERIESEEKWRLL